MALILSSEKSQFVQKAIDIYTQNRLGQYSKYLNSTPTFVTYYAINQALSRADLGSGQVYDIIGPNSPIKFNKILEFPIYNMQQIQPNGSYEDGKYEVDVELSDITILPNTVKPRADDFILIQMPNMKPLLFRVTNFRMGTIQSNDFYMVDLDLYRNDDTWQDIEKNVAEVYHCVFDNIGTNNACFITADQKFKADECLKALNTLTQMYHSMYYYANSNVYVFTDYIYNDTSYNNPAPGWDPNSYIFYGGGAATIPQVPPPPTDVTHYDIYLDKFLMDSGIFFNSADNSTTSVVAYNDFEPTRFDYLFKHTLWNTIITKDTSLLSKYAYYFDHSIEKYTSVIVNEKFPNPTGNTVVILGNESNQIPQYFDSYLLKMIVDGKPEVIKKQNTDNSLNIVNLGAVINGSQDTASFDHIDINPYEIKEKEKEPTNDTGIDPELLYVFDVIYNYIKGIDETIDYQRLIKYFDNPTLWNYRYHLIILYILKSKYESIYNNGTDIGA